ncbi:GHKL domain-containing protein [Brochothrix thermosphacta]|uniref:GHKL domain-containing protein n=2 Tax=Brochothrix thermosphacta TaxID=2756 RepID=A0A1D2LSE5_BROTH|nr:GHKL domain-containing protein [Brochothrix thermosphacta]ATF27019.1 GHKL domain-containing protein [Brochothrix thermosphacta]ATH86377.1 GHKL domain-containing protein [Brochothrix thermosphacta]ODJ63174.1 hypothetical protein BFR36_11705 [Brochothrix thermosphacta]ODJ72807.1 hypothetical protein BFR39_12470 [Brochothrix thermosphacta]
MNILNPIFFIISSLNLGAFFFPYPAKKKFISIFLTVIFSISIFSNSTLFKIGILLLTVIILFLTDSLTVAINFLSGFLLYSFIALSYFYLLNVFNLITLLNSSLPWILLFFVCNFLTIIIHTILKKRNQSSSIFQKKGKNVYFIFLVEVLLLIVLYSFFSKVYIPLIDTLLQQNPLLLLGMFLLIGIIIFILIMIFHKMKIDAKIAKQIQEQQKILYSYVNEIKSQKHDFNSNLTTLQHLVLTKKHKELELFLNSLLDENDTINQSMITSIPEFSALLFKYEKKAKKENITLSLYIEAKIEDSPLSLYKLNKLLGNVLVNAIEAAESTNERDVSLTIKKNHQILYFIIENSGTFNEDVKKYMFHPNQTSKINKEDHGYGLYIVNKIVNEVNGSINFTQTNSSVICTIDIPLE